MRYSTYDLRLRWLSWNTVDDRLRITIEYWYLYHIADHLSNTLELEVAFISIPTLFPINFDPHDLK